MTKLLATTMLACLLAAPALADESFSEWDASQGDLYNYDGIDPVAPDRDLGPELPHQPTDGEPDYNTPWSE